MTHHDAHTHGHADCREMFAQLSAYIDGELDDAGRLEIETHAAACIKCHVCLETLKRTVALTRHAADAPVPREFSDRLAYHFSELLKERDA